MVSASQHTLIQRIKHISVRVLLILGLTAILATSFVVLQEPLPIYAASSTSSTARTDRRPDRERPVVAPKPTATSSTSGLQDASDKDAKPRVVRR